MLSRQNLLSNRVGDSLGFRTEARSFIPPHSLKHLEPEVVIGQLVIGVIRFIEVLASL
jgi:hypothetical protein